MERFLPVAAPVFAGNEKKYVMDCLDSTWISSTGKYINEFETGFAEYCGAKHGLSCSNGTVALHLALLALGIGPGDEVIVPTLTFVATPNAVTYCGARPVFVDSEPETWNMDVNLMLEAITPRTKGIIVVHLYGHPMDMDPVMEIARERGLFVVEDAAEAHGGEYKGRRTGALADIATFSFYGNKIITTGEGGMVTTNSDELAGKVWQLKGQGQDPHKRYWFPIVGYNYRMTNVAAAIGLAQLEKIDWHLARRRENAELYRKYLGRYPQFTLSPEMPWARNAFWIVCILLNEGVSQNRDDISDKLKQEGIETRPFFYPMHTLPMYKELAEGKSFPVAERLAARGMNVPSSASLTEEDIAFVCDALVKSVE